MQNLGNGGLAEEMVQETFVRLWRTAGKFDANKAKVVAGSNGTFSMWTAADPDRYKIMQITAEQPGNAGQHGKVILSGTAQTSD